ncbi:hypothetical protein ACN6LA_007942, partial [Streptomyces sp. SAS_269]
MALLAALAGGAGGELGRQTWAGLSALVRSPFRRSTDDASDAADLSSGEAELARLEEMPDEPARAHALRGRFRPLFHPVMRAWSVDVGSRQEM